MKAKDYTYWQFPNGDIFTQNKDAAAAGDLFRRLYGEPCYCGPATEKFCLRKSSRVIVDNFSLEDSDYKMTYIPCLPFDAWVLSCLTKD